MAITLTKGQTINLDKSQFDLSKITLGLGWKIRSTQVGFWKSFLGNPPTQNIDLDAVALVLNSQDKISSIGNSKLVGGDVIFFNNLSHPSGHVVHSGDNRIGGAGHEDDEQIFVNLHALSDQYHKVVFAASIYQGNERGQHFGMVENAYIRAVDAQGKEIARYELSRDATYEGKCTVVFGEVSRHASEWKFQAIGQAYPQDDLVSLVKRHYP